MNWILQVYAISLFALRTIPMRFGSSLATIVGIAGVVGVFVGVLSIAEGFRAAMTVSGTDDVAIVLRGGADSEMSSGLTREETRLIADAPVIVRGESDSVNRLNLLRCAHPFGISSSTLATGGWT